MKAGFLESSSSRRSRLSVAKTPPPLKEDGKFTFDHFSLERFLGRGNFCEVFEATLVDDPAGQAYALKVFDRKQVMRLNKIQDVLMERHCMLRLNEPGHPNVIKMIATFKDEFRVCIVYELAENGELWELLMHGGVLTENLAARYILQLCAAVEYIHSKGIIHRDIKAENIVVKRDGNLKLIDFGTAVDLEHPEVKPPILGSPSPLISASNRKLPARVSFAHHIGTPQFMPPEAVQNKDSGKMRDLWSLGCTIYQILTGNPPFDASTNYFIFLKVQAHDLHFPPHFPPGARELVEQLLAPDPARRLGRENGIYDVLNHPYILSLKAKFSSSLARSIAPVPLLQDLCFRSLLHAYFVKLTAAEEQKEEARERAREDAIKRQCLAAVEEAEDEEPSERGREGQGTEEAPVEGREDPSDAEKYMQLIDEVIPEGVKKQVQNPDQPFVKILLDRLHDAAASRQATQSWQDALADQWLKESEKRQDSDDEQKDAAEEEEGDDKRSDGDGENEEK
ncbi:putative AGC kinase [Neospora caninum Liverpool]|uniref:AGC kinase, putative n=1 Tax=Neospora caninum (strain Liverpool) TaxID=572307 RepID=F0VJV5_NEOCL|nr:putative AGC kinase [Neospora caninum Liverpool]CBZ54016.1 putative AGC kinase [Neospora caninum Liverpool]CEL68020.1 TPA: AGC kinase, putative [Neospora caninum Liverpool]|eukprot:XP_003884048.1 putative AGC kinase [Neospora caninum Liverpool]